MKFSIIVPVYNVEKYIEKCLKSIICQTYKNYEVIVICDESYDKSEEKVDNIIKNNKKFKKIKANNTGLSIARNIGVNNSTGDYILFLDSDDYFETDLLEKLNLELNEKIEVLRFQVQEISNNKIIKFNERPIEATTGIQGFEIIYNHYHFIENAWCYCYNSYFYKKNNFEFMKNCIAEDFGLIPYIIFKAKKFKSISYIGYNYVQRKNSLMNNDNYLHKIKKMDDMILQANILKEKIKKDADTESFLKFINNSLITHVCKLKYKDYKIYLKKIKKDNCFNFLNNNNIKQKIKKNIIKIFPYLYYNLISR